MLTWKTRNWKWRIITPNGDFPKGAQVDWVLGHFPPEEEEKMGERLETTTKFIEEFCLAGAANAMNHYNGK